MSKRLLSPDMPFAAHQALSEWVFRGWDVDQHGPHPLWCPTAQTASSTNAAAFMREHATLLALSERSASVVERMRGVGALAGTGVAEYTAQWERLHEVSVSHPEAFWPAVLEHLGFSFATQPSETIQLPSDGNPDRAQWFPGARLNVAACALSGPKHDLDAVAVVAGSERDSSRCAPSALRQYICMLHSTSQSNRGKVRCIVAPCRSLVAPAAPWAMCAQPELTLRRLMSA